MTIWLVSTLTKWHSSLNVQLAHALGPVITKAISSMDTNGFLDHQRFIALSCFAIVTIERSVSKVSSLLCCKILFLLTCRRSICKVLQNFEIFSVNLVNCKCLYETWQKIFYLREFGVYLLPLLHALHTFLT